ncbi:uncharacterized protein NECHADRAFT_88487 [Fusarium vanettenii 77-13-4]|uniref:Rhodopsin domain-containing protein n=1 Tax=Fusarium vanettenii (strain ATCC MYA-4622 / CBS 123669 / FGSC 9596 / NRRL 45880 / 77-13-4) TaxID=660122 RepID=C7ZBP9_FUSV7|nr:uncharacterized protein NECHADRAFT_88487 [Fusarium vanettenii 77-13-4]EEU38602.1 hypothetical protein NECHADRAFT_88487 [Fusarium vanettenii 77-13-4]
MAFGTSGKGTSLFIIQLCCLLLVWITAILRAWVGIIRKSCTMDDWFMYLSVGLYTSLAIFVFRGTVVGGIGKYTDNLTMQEAIVGMQSWYFGELIYGVLSILVRVSISLYILRICRSRTPKRIIYASLTIFRSINNKGSCESSRVTTTAIALSAIAGISDWIIALMPAVILWNIRISRRSKIIIIGLTSLGVLAGIAIIIRIPFIKGLEITKEFLYKTV